MLLPEDRILAIDIGGSHIKATLLDMNGTLLKEYQRAGTPAPADPQHVVDCIKTLAATLPGYTKVSAGFPGMVKNGVVITAPNLDNASWKNIDLAKMLTESLHAPARVVNDADMLGLGVAEGKGLEIMITLGTGFGTAFLLDGKLLPHFEIAHHPVTKKQTYDDYLGDKAFKKYGKKKWNARLRKILPVLAAVFNYDFQYIGGGNSENMTGELPPFTKKVTNLDGIHGGSALWKA